MEAVSQRRSLPAPRRLRPRDDALTRYGEPFREDGGAVLAPCSSTRWSGLRRSRHARHRHTGDHPRGRHLVGGLCVWSIFDEAFDQPRRAFTLWLPFVETSSPPCVHRVYHTSDGVTSAFSSFLGARRSSASPPRTLPMRRTSGERGSRGLWRCTVEAARPGPEVFPRRRTRRHPRCSGGRGCALRTRQSRPDSMTHGKSAWTACRNSSFHTLLLFPFSTLSRCPEPSCTGWREHLGWCGGPPRGSEFSGPAVMPGAGHGCVR